MTFRLRHACFVCAFVAALPTLAQAAEAPTPTATASPSSTDDDWDIWARHPVAMELHFGLGSPASIFGLEVEYSFSPLVAVAAGIGLGGYGPSGGSAVHGAGLVRLRPVRAGTAALVVEGGVSTGGFRVPFYSGDSTPTYQGSWVTFAQFALGGELRSHHGTLIRLTVGFATLIDSNSVACFPGADGGPSCGSTTLLTLPAFDLAVGYAF